MERIKIKTNTKVRRKFPSAIRKPQTNVNVVHSGLRFHIKNFCGLTLAGPNFWKSGDIEIRETTLFWKGIKTDIALTSEDCVDWDLLKQMAQISATKKPFEEITGEDVKNCDREDKECIICQDNLSQCANTGCGHKVFCITCANEFSSGKENACPVCRKRIERLIRIF